MQTHPPGLRLVQNPPNPFHGSHVEWLDLPPKLTCTVYEEKCKSILSKNDSPDVGFEYSVNAYRGCFHGCAYCYARASHQYLDLGAGTDFETKIIAKVNAPERLDEALSKPKWNRDTIVFSGNTDCYQPLEASYQLTRKCLEVCARHRNPVAVITKGALIRRDIDVLQEIHQHASAHVHFSIAFIDDNMSRLIEPGAPRPSMRFRVMKELHESGIPVSISLAPMIPGLNDSDIPALLERAKECGAGSAFMNIVRLPAGVREVFLERLEASFPTRFSKVIGSLKEMRQGRLNDPRFGTRMHGYGARWEAVRWMFTSSCHKHGISC